MKLIKLFFIILSFGLICSFTKNNEIIIKGKFYGIIPNEIEYTIPVNGTWFFGAKKSVVPDSLGNFTITLNENQSSFITLYIPKYYKAASILLVEPGKKYNVEFHLDSKNQKIKVKGIANKTFDLYNSFAHPDFNVLNTSNPLLKDSIFTTISSKIDRQKEKELLQFKKMMEKDSISTKLFNTIKLDREYYFSALKSSIINIKYNPKLTSINNNETLEIWRDLFDKLKPSHSFNLQSPWSYVLLKNYIKFKEVNNHNFLNFKQKEEFIDLKETHTYNINKAKKYIKEEVLEYYYANYLLSSSFSNKENSKELIILFKKFKQEYPKSNYINGLNTYIQPIIDFHKKIEISKINPKIKLVENYKNINTFNDLINPLKGKKVFVDIWGTWCGPCKKELEKKSEYSELLKSNNITMLYICEGSVSKERVWKEMIHFYDLEGLHIHANKKLLEDIINNLGQKDSFAYPRYLLINEEGKIVNNNTTYPSNTKKLKKQIEKAY